MSLVTDLPQDIQFIIAEYGGVLDSLDSSYIVKELINIYPHVCILREIELLRKIQKVKRVHPKLITLYHEEDRSLLTDACGLLLRMSFSGISRDKLEIRFNVGSGVDPSILMEYNEEPESTPYISVDCVPPRHINGEWRITAVLNNRPKGFEIDPWIDHLVNDRDIAQYITQHRLWESNIQDKVALHIRPRTVISSELMDTFRSLGGCVGSLLSHIREKRRVVESMRHILPDWLIGDITREMIIPQVYGYESMIYHRSNYKIDRLLDWLKTQVSCSGFQVVTTQCRDHRIVTNPTIELQNESDRTRLKEILNSMNKLCMVSVSVMDLI